MKIEDATRFGNIVTVLGDYSQGGLGCVVIDAAEFDAFMTAHNYLLECAERAVYEEADDPSHDNLSEAVHYMQKLEGGEE